ncbi:MAG: hypothetical protein JHC26_12810 [Thermofilum sp.]|uniref:hypothetical protein n=1 Tax=Thermofilum sp. TaxID=1961369 RepID=UPI002584AB45|nr:hypothetical protein [Thermofilum sp.]MCI4409967.1 hypothetical protein [Thermofilum sp.]
MADGKRGRPKVLGEYVKVPVNLELEDIEVIDKLVREGMFLDRTDAIRYAIRYAFAQFYPEDIRTIVGRRTNTRMGRPSKDPLQRKA